MKKTEVIKLLAVISAAYPNMKTVEDSMVEIWLDCLKDIDTETALKIAKKHILESPFPPTIADIRKQNVEVTTERLDATQAWGEVMKAIKNFGLYREHEAIKSMSPLTGKTIKYMGWRDICMSEKPDVVRGQFLKMYETMEGREYKNNLLPESFKAEIEGNRLNQITSNLSKKLSLE